MGEFAGVFLQVSAPHADALCPLAGADIQVSVFRQRLFILRNLVALGQIGIEVILAREDAGLSHLAVQRQGGLDGQRHRVLVDHRERARHPQAHLAHRRVRQGLGVIHNSAGTEHLGARRQLHMHFQPNVSFIVINHR